jgi:hypothetical protein
MARQSNKATTSCYIITTTALFLMIVTLMSSYIPISSKAIYSKSDLSISKDKKQEQEQQQPSLSSFLLGAHLDNVTNLTYYDIKNKNNNNNMTGSNIAHLPNNSITQNNNINETQLSAITYTAKFACGSVSKDVGMLTAGYYDTDISVFNKQQYPVVMLLNLIVNNGNSSPNSIIKTVQPQRSTAISCKDMLGLFNIKVKDLVEGFATITVQLDNGILGSLSSSGMISAFTPAPRSLSSQAQINLLDVHVFYSVNSFSLGGPAAATHMQNLPVDKITFSILNDTSKKIPDSMLLKVLYSTVDSQTDTIFDPEAQVKRLLADKFHLSNSDLTGVKLKIYDVNTGASMMLDRHAIASLQVQPRAIYH